MKQKKVLSQYKNPDRLINTLRKRIETAMENTKRDHGKFKEYRDTQIANAPKLIISWKKGSFAEQSILALCPNEIHVGEYIQQVGRIVQVVEKFNEKGQPLTVFKYELTRTNLIPSVLKTGQELKDIKT